VPGPANGWLGTPLRRAGAGERLAG